MVDEQAAEHGFGVDFDSGYGVQQVTLDGLPFVDATAIEIRAGANSDTRATMEMFWTGGLDIEGQMYAEYGLRRGAVPFSLTLVKDRLPACKIDGTVYIAYEVVVRFEASTAEDDSAWVELTIKQNDISTHIGGWLYGELVQPTNGKDTAE
jgi:hypothetical protein